VSTICCAHVHFIVGGTVPRLKLHNHCLFANFLLPLTMYLHRTLHTTLHHRYFAIALLNKEGSVLKMGGTTKLQNLTVVYQIHRDGEYVCVKCIVCSVMCLVM